MHVHVIPLFDIRPDLLQVAFLSPGTKLRITALCPHKTVRREIDLGLSAGKHTGARAVAKRMNLIYVDTGAMYRALALYVIRCGVDPADTKKVIAPAK